MKFLLILLISGSAWAQTTTTPNMNLPLAIPGITTGPAWANAINSAFTAVDSHNHAFGQGVQIQPNGINISSDLPFNSHNATNLRTTRFYPQLTPITNASPDIGALYVSGNELYYNDVTGGNQIQITSNGSVNAGAGSITGLPSGTASASYSGGTFTWQSATSTAANMDAQSYILRNSGASSNGLTLQAPAGMAANYSLTLPALPAALDFVSLDTAGNITATIPVSGGITASNIASGTITTTQISASAGITGSQLASKTVAAAEIVDATMTTTQISAAAGIVATQLAPAVDWSNTATVDQSFSSGTHTVVQITSFIPSSGRPVFVSLSGDNSLGGHGYVNVPAGWSVTFNITLGLVLTNTVTIDNTSGTSPVIFPLSALNTINSGVNVGSTHTATLQIVINTAGSGSVTVGKLVMQAIQI